MEDKEQVIEYITRVEKVANQLGRNGEPMPASRVVEKILRSLIDDFESIVYAIVELKDLSVSQWKNLPSHWRPMNKGERRSTNRVIKHYRRNLI